MIGYFLTLHLAQKGLSTFYISPSIEITLMQDQVWNTLGMFGSQCYVVSTYQFAVTNTSSPILAHSLLVTVSLGGPTNHFLLYLYLTVIPS